MHDRSMLLRMRLKAKRTSLLEVKTDGKISLFLMRLIEVLEVGKRKRCLRFRRSIVRRSSQAWRKWYWRECPWLRQSTNANPDRDREDCSVWRRRPLSHWAQLFPLGAEAGFCQSVSARRSAEYLPKRGSIWSGSRFHLDRGAR